MNKCPRFVLSNIKTNSAILGDDSALLRDDSAIKKFYRTVINN